MRSDATSSKSIHEQRYCVIGAGLDENLQRIERLLVATKDFSDYRTSYVGVQDFVVDNSNTLSLTEADVYWKVSSTDSVAILRDRVRDFFAVNYPSAALKFAPPTTIFEKLFETAEADVEARLAYSGLLS